MSILSWIGKLWASPWTLIGLVVGLAAFPLGARTSIGYNSIQFHNFPLGRGAITLGNVIIYSRGRSPEEFGCYYGDERHLCLGLHEEAHTLQYQCLGPLFIPVYLLCGGISASNPFEQAANNYAAGGSWKPWRLESGGASK